MLEAVASPPVAVTLEAFTDIDFWTGVGIIAGVYTILALGLQLNFGFTGIQNFGQAAFMAIGPIRWRSSSSTTAYRSGSRCRSRS